MHKCFSWCDLHEEAISEQEYEYKGCWKCHHLNIGSKFPYVTTSEAACELKVSESTIRRWWRQGRIKGRIFERQRNRADLGAVRKLHLSLVEAVRGPKAKI